MTEQIRRIMEYEKMLDQANELMKRKSLSSDNETLLRELIDKLKAYYESET
ncbi:MAG: hypothetical protein K6A14_03090 [Erysipelotrichaceae bacterium]|nr:hypothetical protein [Erysipelotrichaceae bacterium]